MFKTNEKSLSPRRNKNPNTILRTILITGKKKSRAFHLYLITQIFKLQKSSNKINKAHILNSIVVLMTNRKGATTQSRTLLLITEET